MPKFVRVSAIAVGVLAIAVLPLFIALSLAGSYGWNRETARSIAFVVTMVLFGMCYLVIRRLAQRRARREVDEELDQILASYRDDEAGGAQ